METLIKREELMELYKSSESPENIRYLNEKIKEAVEAGETKIYLSKSRFGTTFRQVMWIEKAGYFVDARTIVFADYDNVEEMWGVSWD